VIEAVLKQIILNVVRPFSTAYAVYAANHATLQFGMALQHGHDRNVAICCHC
jgi:hypothetical protein